MFADHLKVGPLTVDMARSLNHVMEYNGSGGPTVLYVLHPEHGTPEGAVHTPVKRYFAGHKHHLSLSAAPFCKCQHA
jgi:hypothetical protein